MAKDLVPTRMAVLAVAAALFIGSMAFVAGMIAGENRDAPIDAEIERHYESEQQMRYAIKAPVAADTFTFYDEYLERAPEFDDRLALNH